MLHDKKQLKKEQKIKKGFHNPEILDVNLLKDEIRISFDWKQHLITFVVILIIVFGFIAEIYFGLNWWAKIEKERSEKIEQEMATLNKETVEFKKQINEALNYYDRAKVTTQLLDNHIYWTHFFYWLEDNTLDTIALTKFDSNINGNYSLNMVADNYADASWETKLLSQDKMVKNIDIEEVKYSNKEGKVFTQFDLNLEIDPSIFKKQD